MKPKIQAILFLVITILFLNIGRVNAESRALYTDSVCCPPDSLKVVSTNYPVFCVSWHVSADSNCRNPYGFEVEWRPFPGSGPWTTMVIVYTGGTTINFCTSVDMCRNYQWGVRTICDTANGGTYSDWVFGNKFTMQNCFGRQVEGLDNNSSKPNNTTNKKVGNSSLLIKSKDD